MSGSGKVNGLAAELSHEFRYLADQSTNGADKGSRSSQGGLTHGQGRRGVRRRDGRRGWGRQETRDKRGKGLEGGTPAEIVKGGI